MGADSEQGKKGFAIADVITYIEGVYDLGFQAGNLKAAEIVIREIESSTGPTGGWLDSPKAICASIVASLSLEGRKQEK